MNRLTYIGIGIAVLFIIIAIFAPLIATHDVTAQNLAMRYAAPSAAHWFGTDSLGRDVFSRVIFGARISLQVGIIVVAVSAFIGIIIGAISGFYGGFVDKFLSGYVFNVFLAFPGLLLAIALAAFVDERAMLEYFVGANWANTIISGFGLGLSKIILALCIIGWVGYARLMRGQVLKIREYDFVQAARALGASNFRILFTHILPNAIQPLIVQASLGMAGAVLSEASLSFLGLGIPPPAPSWGTMLEESRGLDTLFNAPHAFFFPALFIALTVLSFNFLGDGLREYLDPKQRSR
ncbi:MAG: ABC transporter permease [Acidobacteriota bacterium]|nr:ABC transporter permease [Acidobacteriota bacterium]